MKKAIYNVAMPVIEEATKQFGSRLSLDDEKFGCVKSICDLIDSVFEREIEGYCVEINYANTDITLSVLTYYFELWEQSEFRILAQMVKGINLSTTDDGLAEIAFVCNGVWNEKKTQN